MQATSVKTIIWETNFNQKLCCDAFIHIDFAPSSSPVRSAVEQTIIEIKTADNSHEPVKVSCYDIIISDLQSICYDMVTMVSHGKPAVEYAKHIMDEKYPGKVSWTTPMAIYYYKKIN